MLQYIVYICARIWSMRATVLLYYTATCMRPVARAVHHARIITDCCRARHGSQRMRGKSSLLNGIRAPLGQTRSKKISVGAALPHQGRSTTLVSYSSMPSEFANVVKPPVPLHDFALIAAVFEKTSSFRPRAYGCPGLWLPI
eukprot:6181228-Pleurochrysis_carterae.AAC.1